MPNNLLSLMGLSMLLSFSLSSCQTLGGRNPASVAMVKAGDQIVCEQEGFKVKFSADLIQERSQDVEVSYGQGSEYSAHLNFYNDMAEIKINDCPDENQCWKARTLLETFKISAANSLQGRFEYEFNGKVLTPKVTKCKLVK